MLNAAEIKKEIARLEYEESSYPNYAKLADLYIIRDQMMQGGGENDRMMRHSAAPSPEPLAESVGRYGDSDFLRAVSGLDQGSAWTVMDELMDTLRVVNSRVYESVMRKLQ